MEPPHVLAGLHTTGLDDMHQGIRRVKVFRITKEMHRNKLEWYDRINDIACGVVNQTIFLKRGGIL